MSNFLVGQQRRDDDEFSDASTVNGGGEIQMNQDAMYGNEEQEKKISDPRTGRWFMAFNIIAMFVLLIVIALKADINQLYDQQIAASKQAYKKPTTPATNTNGATNSKTS